ncbi:hypothetical protein M404DRAFT_392460 [Pisolithus tinctorius Marx 270]|uniref:Uncharacterized protein n=1 Tax=Pisolithus tinctorius Marx 270 TaxID=870435 RepID=A0A0C3PH23_PISTI|nr:hypothetical protein M404DRAFT_392460 [Pisolithus tinctorius Marx 270]
MCLARFIRRTYEMSPHQRPSSRLSVRTHVHDLLHTPAFLVHGDGRSGKTTLSSAKVEVSALVIHADISGITSDALRTPLGFNDVDGLCDSGSNVTLHCATVSPKMSRTTLAVASLTAVWRCLCMVEFLGSGWHQCLFGAIRALRNVQLSS